MPGIASVENSTGTYFTMIIAELAQQFSGRAFGELVLEHCKKSSNTQLAAALLGSIQDLTEQSKKSVDQQMKSMNESALSGDFWRKDCGQVLLEVTAKARQHMLANEHRASDEELFNVFQTISMSFAHTCSKDKSAKAFVQKSVGVGFFGRLLG